MCTSSETVEIAEHYRFFKRLQEQSEGVVKYMAELCKLAKTCNFNDYLSTALHDQFVCSLKNMHI